MARWARLWLWLGCALATLHAAASEDKKKTPSDSEMSEYKQDFLDFDLNKDNQIDAQEVRSQFKGDLDPKELHQFFIDVDKDNTGTVTLQEYIDYAITLQ
uniref:EF-hand domain-containing protein n=2 Tax=Alexandrium andersonii TaxID=327968 RepID=A0A7S2MHM8_9DINO|mmetsp:Transcript_68986/g.154494  ORF Transcript_68986/g.154494 Transcript_68986/m.154494 type:complete len:100 (+) Transcript_68986:81-380(+)